MFNTFKKTIKKIEIFQEDAEDLTFAIKKLIGGEMFDESVELKEDGRAVFQGQTVVYMNEDGQVKINNKFVGDKEIIKEAYDMVKKNIEENVSVGDIAIVKSPEGDKIKDNKEIKESDVDGEEGPSDNVDIEPDATDDDIDSDSGVDSGDLSDDENINRVKRAQAALEGPVGKFVEDYFRHKLSGNFGQARVEKRKIEREIRIKDLDREVVYHGSTTVNCIVRNPSLPIVFRTFSRQDFVKHTLAPALESLLTFSNTQSISGYLL